MSDDGNLDYSQYSYRELLEALDNINSKKYPQNYANLQAALEKVGPAQREALAQSAASIRHEEGESPDSDYQSNPDVRRVNHLLTGIAVAGISGYLLWVDDLTLPLKVPIKIALSGTGEALAYLAFLFAITVPVSLVLDSVDHRDNQKKYLLFAMFAESIATGLLVFASIISTSQV